MQDLNISFIQSELYWNDTDTNLKHFDTHLQQLNSDADIVVLPEMFNTGFLVEPYKMPEQASNKAIAWLQNKASKYNAVFCTSLIVKEGDKYFNRLHWVQPDGMVAYYNKRHLFTYGNEDRYFVAGETALIVEYKNWRIKPLICYDLRFPVWAKNTLIEGVHAYDLLIYIANWPQSRIIAWQALLQARAIENQCYVLGVNRVGEDAKGHVHNGASLLIDPKGQALSAKIEQEQESVQNSVVSARVLQDFRQKFPVGKDWDTFDIIQT